MLTAAFANWMIELMSKNILYLTIFFPAAVFLSALSLQYVSGYAPCELCMFQRYPYYVGIPAACAVAFLERDNPSIHKIMTFVASGYIVSAFVGLLQAGAEWRLWDLYLSCGASLPASSGDVSAYLEAIKATPMVSCTEPALRILGLSLAGWNFIASSIAGILSMAVAVRYPKV